MIELDMLSTNFILNKKTNYFSHYIFPKIKDISIDLPFGTYFTKNFEKLVKDNWKLHKRYVKEGVNPNDLAKIIRNDEIEKLQEISSREYFDFNQKITPSLYEKCSFINTENVTLIDYAAFFSAIKCFKYLLMNGAKVNNTGKYAIAGGNIEIIHLCEQNRSSFEGAYEAAIKFHKNDIFKYIYENEIVKYSFEKIINLLLFPTNEFINIDLINFFLANKEIDVNYKNDQILFSNYICII